MNAKTTKRVVSSLDPEHVVQFVRVLAELRAVGLTRDQYSFLKVSADLTKRDVDAVLYFVDVAYEKIKEAIYENLRIPG